jgi:hypothetical protein
MVVQSGPHADGKRTSKQPDRVNEPGSGTGHLRPSLLQQPASRPTVGRDELRFLADMIGLQNLGRRVFRPLILVTCGPTCANGTRATCTRAVRGSAGITGRLAGREREAKPTPVGSMTASRSRRTE